MIVPVIYPGLPADAFGQLEQAFQSVFAFFDVFLIGNAQGDIAFLGAFMPYGKERIVPGLFFAFEIKPEILSLHGHSCWMCMVWYRIFCLRKAIAISSAVSFPCHCSSHILLAF
jgi:hypothetical protein